MGDDASTLLHSQHTIVWFFVVLPRNSLDDVSGAQFAPQMAGEREERQQFGQAPLPPTIAVSSVPAGTKAAKSRFACCPLRQIDGLGSGLTSS